MSRPAMERPGANREELRHSAGKGMEQELAKRLLMFMLNEKLGACRSFQDFDTGVQAALDMKCMNANPRKNRHAKSAEAREDYAKQMIAAAKKKDVAEVDRLIAEIRTGIRLVAAARNYRAGAICKILDENPGLVNFVDENGNRPIEEVLKRAHARDRGEGRGWGLVKLLMDRNAAMDQKVLSCAYDNSTMMIYGQLERIYMDRNPSDKGVGDMIRAIAIAKSKEKGRGQPCPVGAAAPKRYAPRL